MPAANFEVKISKLVSGNGVDESDLELEEFFQSDKFIGDNIRTVNLTEPDKDEDSGNKVAAQERRLIQYQYDVLPDLELEFFQQVDRDTNCDVEGTKILDANLVQMSVFPITAKIFAIQHFKTDDVCRKVNGTVIVHDFLGPYGIYTGNGTNSCFPSCSLSLKEENGTSLVDHVVSPFPKRTSPHHNPIRILKKNDDRW